MPPHERFNDDKDKGRITPLEDRKKCMPPRKRQRQHQLTTCYVCCCLCDHCSIRSLKSIKPRDVTADDAVLFEENDNDDDLLDAAENAQLTQEVVTLKDAVGRMQSQVSAASAKLTELRALVNTLVEQRASQQQRRHQELKKCRVEL